MSFFGIPIRNGLSLGLGAVASLTNGPPFLPSELFYNGTVQGAWYDPSDVAIGWRYNLLTYTEQFDNAAWSKINLVTSGWVDVAVAPDGTITADRMIENTTASVNHYIGGTVSVVSGTTYTLSFYAKTNGRNIVAEFAASGFGSNKQATFNLTAGTTSSLAGVTSSITNAGNGWYRCTATCSATATVSTAFYFILDNGGNQVYTGDGTSGIFIWGAQLQTGSTATTYQQIVTPEISYLNYDADPILYQDSAGTTPVWAVEQPVGLMLDKSKGLVLGSEVVINGDFSSSANWTLSSGGGGSATISGGLLTLSGGNTTFPSATQSSVLTNGRWYRITVVTTASITAGSVGVRIGGSTNNFPIVSAAGTYTATVLADGANIVFIRNSGYTDTAVIDSISVRELPGNHASQTTSASRPTLRARYNLLTRSEEFNDAVWGLAGGANAPTKGTVNTDKPDGTTGTVNTIIYPAVAGGGGNHSFVFQSTGATYLNVPLTYTVWMRVASGTGTIYLQVEDNSVAPSGGNFFTGPALTLTTTWQRFTLSGTRTSAAGNTSIAIGFDTRAAAGQTNAGPLTVQVWGAQLIQNAVFPSNTYQRIGAATDYATGAAFPPYLFFDGTDDSMLTNSVDFTGTDKMTVFAGVGRLSGSLGMITELSSTATNNGAFYLANDVASNRYRMLATGTAGNLVDSAIVGAPPTTNVLSGSIAITPANMTLRVNGGNATTSSSTLGSGNFGNYPLYIGRRNNASLPFNGSLFSLIIAGQSYSSGQISSTESWVAAKTPLGTI